MKILAVSGGIDSVVMLHRYKDDDDVVVAHFDHGIRQNSHDDAVFVERLAAQYRKKFELGIGKLGKKCSEALAREKRYEFLRQIAAKYNGKIYVAHHAEDIIESIAINLIRGTGWRGLTPMYDSEIERPLSEWRKSEIYRYATNNDLHFRQDPTNTEDNYLRNRIREKLRFLPEENKQKLIELYRKQVDIRAEIEQKIIELVQIDGCRYKKELAKEPELLRYVLESHDIRLTRPQLQRCRKAIESFAPGKRFSLDKSRYLCIHRYSFEIML